MTYNNDEDINIKGTLNDGVEQNSSRKKLKLTYFEENEQNEASSEASSKEIDYANINNQNSFFFPLAEPYLPTIESLAGSVFDVSKSAKLCMPINMDCINYSLQEENNSKNSTKLNSKKEASAKVTLSELCIDDYMVSQPNSIGNFNLVNSSINTIDTEHIIAEAVSLEMVKHFLPSQKEVGKRDKYMPPYKSGTYDFPVNKKTSPIHALNKGFTLKECNDDDNIEGADKVLENPYKKKEEISQADADLLLKGFTDEELNEYRPTEKEYGANTINSENNRLKKLGFKVQLSDEHRKHYRLYKNKKNRLNKLNPKISKLIKIKFKKEVSERRICRNLVTYDLSALSQGRKIPKQAGACRSIQNNKTTVKKSRTI